MPVLNPQLEEDITLKTGGVTFIDEAGLYLHPRLQQRIFRTLQEIFPKVQFTVTTHEPKIISSVKRENLIELQDYEVIEPGQEVLGTMPT